MSNQYIISTSAPETYFRTVKRKPRRLLISLILPLALFYMFCVSTATHDMSVRAPTGCTSCSTLGWGK